MDSELQTWIKDLPNSPEGHWGLGHLPVVQYVQEELKPKTIMEIGLNNGTSASMWLFTCPEVNFHSVDIGFHKFVSTVAGLLRVKFGDRFDFTMTDSRNLHRLGLSAYDLIFIDGGHKHDVCLSDLKFAQHHGRYILLDDTGGNSPGVTSALKEFLSEGSKLELIKEWNIGAGCRLYRNLVFEES